MKNEGLARRRRGPTILLLAVTSVLLAPACGDGPADRGSRPEDDASPSAASLPDARYVTLVAWTGEEGRPAGALWLENGTEGDGELARRYRGWTVDGDTARAVLRVDDRLPVPAAGWRPLPAPGLRISVDPRGRLSSLAVGGSGTRLLLGGELASRRGATDADERFRRGRLFPAADTAGVAVTAAVLRFEHLAGDPGRAGPSRVLIVGAPGGRGLLVLDGGTARPWSRGWSWGGETALAPVGGGGLPDSVGADGAWRFRTPAGAGDSVDWRVPVPDTTGPGGRGARSGRFLVLPVSARLAPGNGELPARGFLLLAR